MLTVERAGQKWFSGEWGSGSRDRDGDMIFW